jgi:hypothetical protein
VGYVGRVAVGVLARHRYPSGDRGLSQVGYQCRRELRIAADRVAVFDNDGALWSEKPIPIQLDFTLYRLAEQARSDSTLAGREPYRAALERDYRWLGEVMVKHYHGDESDLDLLLRAVESAFDFMRPFAEELYQIPPERVIGSALGLDFRMDDAAIRAHF